MLHMSIGFLVSSFSSLTCPFGLNIVILALREGGLFVCFLSFFLKSIIVVSERVFTAKEPPI